MCYPFTPLNIFSSSIPVPRPPFDNGGDYERRERNWRVSKFSGGGGANLVVVEEKRKGKCETI
jgi:hypothetical protein